jgi:acetyltransferase-like isoleucine patch superfamily enzyme
LIVYLLFYSIFIYFFRYLYFTIGIPFILYFYIFIFFHSNKIGLLDLIHPESGKEPFFEPPFHVDYGYNIKVGEVFYANFGYVIYMCGRGVGMEGVHGGCAVATDRILFRCVILDCAPVTIGNNVKFGPGVHIYPH